MRPTLTVGLLGMFAAAAACTDVAPRNPPPRGTLGQELYGVVCDRVGGQSLHEDLTGASFHAICHDDAGGYASKVDQSVLPLLVDGQPDVNGKPVPLATQQAQRAYGVARLERLAADRDRLVAALDAAFPDVQVPIADVASADPAQSCNPAPGTGKGSLHTELSNLLSRFDALYDDGTLPRSTEALGGLVSAYNRSTDPATGAQASWARLNARAGYRPAGVALGALRPVLAYPKLRALTNDALRLISPDSDPYALKPMLDAQGQRVPVPGGAYPQMNAVSTALAFELSNEVDDPVPSPLLLPVTHDAMVGGRTVLGRPRTDLELLTSIFFAEDPSFAGGLTGPAYIVQRDPRGYVAVATAAGGALPAPFVNEGDGLPAVDAVTGQFKTSNSTPAPSPFFAPGATAAPSRDASGRALGAGGAGLYAYVDTSQSLEARLIAHVRGVTTGKSLVDSIATDQHETLMNMLAGAYVLFGPRASATRMHGSQSLTYSGFQPVHAPLGDLVYALGQILADPTTDATLSLTSTLMKNNTTDVARVVGDTLWAKDQSSADTTAKIPAASTFWDEMIDVLVAMAQDTTPSTDPNGKRLLEDILTAFAQPASLGLSKAVAAQATNVDAITYDRNDLNGPAVNTTKPGSPPATAADRTKPDTGANRSELQRFAQLVHDTNGVTMCNKEGAVVHGVGVPVLGTANVCASTLGSSASTGQLCCNAQGLTCLTPDTACTCNNGRPFHECEVLKISNLAGFYLDSIAKKASLYFRNKLLRDGVFGAVPDGGLPDGAVQSGPGGLGAAGVMLNEMSSGIGLHTGADGGPDDTYNDSDAGGPGPAAPGFWDPLLNPNSSACGAPAGTACAWSWNPFVSPPMYVRPKPGWLNRLAGFDLLHDSTMPATAPATNNYLTNHFILDLQGTDIGTTACPERLIADPCASDPNCFDRQADSDVAADGMVHGLRSCPSGQWLYQRDADSFFLTEENGFLDALAPLATAFANHGREDLFIQVMETLHKHWQTAAGAAATPGGATECKLSPTASCAKDGADSYEPLLGKIFGSDL